MFYLKIDKILFCLLLFSFVNQTISLKDFGFDDITSELLPSNSGTIAAFGHLNADKFADIITLQQGGKKIKIFLGTESGKWKPYQTQQDNCSLDSVITSAVPGDFNGDSHTDILVTLVDQDSTDTNVRILWGSDGIFNCSKSATVMKITGQPIIVDFNGDMIPDIIGEVNFESTRNRYVWISSTNKNFTRYSLQESVNQTIRIPHSSGLLDVNNDLVTDMVITGDTYFEVWMHTGTNYSRNHSIPYPVKFAKYFQSTFVDLTLDGKIDHVLPACRDEDCTFPAILKWDSNAAKWDVLLDNFKHDGENWTFKLPKGTNSDITAYLPVTLRAGDVDMDGYPDFLLLLQSKNGTKTVILKNAPCSNCSSCERCLEIMWDIPGLSSVKNAEIAAFFDIYEDGVLDIMISSKEDGEWKIHALKNTEALDFCFMKVLVLSGLCSDCTYEQMPYGVNQPGPIVLYNMTKSDGHPHVTSAVQLSQTAFFSLHLPYSLFGLGQTPNFIDALTVAVPAKFQKNVHKHEWTQIIPNSQIVVIPPTPPYDDSRWVKKLYVTPSQNVFLTCLALIGTCIFVAFIIFFLHWRERKEDKKEKMQEAYRFHFDAM